MALKHKPGPDCLCCVVPWLIRSQGGSWAEAELFARVHPAQFTVTAGLPMVGKKGEARVGGLFLNGTV